jgi:membrane-bound lytic murein transglycosylase D
MNPLARKILASSCVLTAGLVAGFSLPRPRWFESLAPRQSTPPQTAQKPLDPIPAGRGGAESAELRMLRQAESEMFPDLGPAQKLASRPQPQRCGPGDDPRCKNDEDPLLDGGTTDAEWMAGLRMPDLPVKADARVEKFVRYFTQNTQGRKVFRSWLKRSGRYRGIVASALRERFLPQDLQALVMIESGYNASAVSSAGAAGLWQLMPETARIYKLRVEEDYDERRSVEKSTDAAVQHISDLYQKFSSWELAFAAYDMGYRALVSRVRELGTNDYWTIAGVEGALPREAVLYVPKLIACAIVMRNLDRYGFDDTHLDPPISVADLDVPPGTSLRLVARAAGTSLQNIRELNPEILTDRVPDRGSGFALHVPSGGISRAHAMLPRLLDSSDRMENGVGSDFDWGKDELPDQRTADDFDPLDPPRARRRVQRADEDTTHGYRDAQEKQVIFYRVGESDTLPGIARVFGCSVDDLVADNKLDPDAKLHKGMLLKVRAAPGAMHDVARRRAEERQRAEPDEDRSAQRPKQKDEKKPIEPSAGQGELMDAFAMALADPPKKKTRRPKNVPLYPKIKPPTE